MRTRKTLIKLCHRDDAQRTHLPIWWTAQLSVCQVFPPARCSWHLYHEHVAHNERFQYQGVYLICTYILANQAPWGELGFGSLVTHATCKCCNMRRRIGKHHSQFCTGSKHLSKRVEVPNQPQIQTAKYPSAWKVKSGGKGHPFLQSTPKGSLW